MDFMLDERSFVESSINCPPLSNLHISDLQVLCSATFTRLLSRSVGEMLIHNKMDGYIFRQTRRLDHFIKLPNTKCFLRISISHVDVAILHENFHEYPIFKGSNFEQFLESMTKLHKNFVNLFGLGSLNNIYLSLFHSTLAPVAGKRSNK